jgi:prevent-host-death family protein
MQVNVDEAEAQLSELIEAALAGEEVIITRGNKPIARLVPIQKSEGRFRMMAGKFGTSPDFLEPMSEEDLKTWE